MKVAINKCYGGFSLSAIAVKRLAMKDSSVIESVPLAEWDVSKPECKDIGNGFFVGRFGTVFRGDTVYVLNDQHEPATRMHPDVIEIIEELGKDASSDYSELKIVEIPDGIDWEIDEYDGIEWIAEAHRTWR